MIRYLKHNEIDQQKWDNTLSKSFNKLPFASFWYLDLVSPKWDALVYGDYEEIMPLPIKKKYGISYISQPLLCPRLGVFSTKKEKKFNVDKYLNFLFSKFVLVDICLNEFNVLSDNYSSVIEKKYYQVLDLNNNHEILKSNYNKSHRKNINKFNKSKIIKIKASSDIEEFCEFKFQLFKEKNVFFNKKMQASYLKTMQGFWEKEMLNINYGVDENNNVVGGCCSIDFIFDKVGLETFIFESAKKSGLLHFLLDDLFKKRLSKRFDFMGSNLPGVKSWNLGFGSKDDYYLWVRKKTIKNIF